MPQHFRFHVVLKAIHLKLSVYAVWKHPREVM